MPLREIRVEDEVFAAEGQLGVGAVRVVEPDHLLVYIEGYGEVRIGPENIAAAHDGKVVLDPATLDPALAERLGHVHDGEMRDPAAPPPKPTLGGGLAE
jgi:hypothetical protein